MYPVLFRIPEFLPLIGGIPINSFGTMMVLACLAGGWVLQKELERHGHEGKEAWDLAFLSLAAGLVGAKLYWVLTHPARLSADPLGTIFSGTGLTWYGGFAAGLLAFYVGLRRTSLPVRETIDGLGLGLPLAIAVGRVGCFLAGDDYGRPTASRFGVAFPEGHPPTSVQMLQDRFGITVDPALVEQFGQVVLRSTRPNSTRPGSPWPSFSFCSPASASTGMPPGGSSPSGSPYTAFSASASSCSGSTRESSSA